MSTKMKLPDGSIKFAVHGVFGENAENVFICTTSAKKIARRLKRLMLPEMFATFDTQKEADAYQQGLMDMQGWLGVYYTTPQLHAAVFQMPGIQVLPHDGPPSVPADDPNEVALIASIMAYNLTEEIKHHKINSLHALMDLIPAAAIRFCIEYGHIIEWDTFISSESNSRFTCFEDFVVAYGRKYLNSNK
ncbi:hypothetical protein [Chitinophaga cymbidii]|uniref:Uncharacterized protein n=1 Tax=Chitinophaga cymbidii TaxID=1096750 RepID=A0A512RFQ1_9BACT|nr:hypothetical protein [Chitinophaga cymbidii]GEP94478.1 hypothetical protein CCY01nite_07380 [Chitinophaga cymbidii]